MSTEDRILDAALRVFAEVGFRGATTKRIAEEAGVNEVTLFRRFKGKEQLLLEAMRRPHRDDPFTPLPERPADVATELGLWAREHLHHLVRMRVLMRSAMCEMADHPQLCASAGEGPERVAKELTDYLERARASGLASGDWEARAAASFLMGSIFAEAIGRDMMPHRHPYTVDEVADRYAQLFVRAIGARREDPR